MKFIFAVLILFAFIPSSWAEITPCDQEGFTCNSNNECTCPAGCKYQPAQGEGYYTIPAKCIPCDEYHYDDNCTESCSGYGDEWYAHQYYTDTEHPDLVTRGARTKYECYREISCKQPDGTDSPESECREYNRGDGYPHFISCRNSDNTFYPAMTDDGSVIRGAGRADCVNNNCDFHIEGSACFANKIYCDKILSTPPGWKASSDTSALWQITTSSWNISGCYYYNVPNTTFSIETGISISGNAKELGTVNNKAINCHAAVTIWPPFTSLTGFPNFSDVNQTNNWSDASVDLTNASSTASAGKIRSFQCIGCASGYYPTTDTTYKIDGVTITDNDNMLIPSTSGFQGGPFYACATGGGYYSKGCSSFDNSPGHHFPYFACPYSANRCVCGDTVKQPCYAGMTSDAGATSKNQCHYTSDTQFCDAYGCFTFDNLNRNATTIYSSSTGTPENPENVTIWNFSHSYR